MDRKFGMRGISICEKLSTEYLLYVNEKTIWMFALKLNDMHVPMFVLLEFCSIKYHITVLI